MIRNMQKVGTVQMADGNTEPLKIDIKHQGTFGRFLLQGWSGGAYPGLVPPQTSIGVASLYIFFHGTPIESRAACHFTIVPIHLIKVAAIFFNQLLRAQRPGL